jgi:hypothetical protein
MMAWKMSFSGEATTLVQSASRSGGMADATISRVDRRIWSCTRGSGGWREWRVEMRQVRHEHCTHTPWRSTHQWLVVCLLALQNNKKRLAPEPEDVIQGECVLGLCMLQACESVCVCVCV